MVLLAAPQPTAACPFYNPICWIEEGCGLFHRPRGRCRVPRGNVFTLDLEGAFNDLVDIVENHVCGTIPLTVLDLIGADVAEGLYNNSCDAPHGIAPVILDKLRPYFMSSFDSVVVHEDCDFENRNAITFGEHIYFRHPASGIIPGYRRPGGCGRLCDCSRTNSSMSSSTGGRASPILSAATGKNVAIGAELLEVTSGFPAGLSSRPTCTRPWYSRT